MYVGEFLPSWEKKVKVVNLPTLAKKGSVSWTVKPKFAKRGDDSSETWSDLVPYKGGLPPINNIVLESSSPSSTRTRSSMHSTRVSLSLLHQTHLWMFLLPTGLVAARRRHPH